MAAGCLHRRPAGFTLVETMVAVVAGVLVLTIVWSLVSAMTRSFASSRDALTSLQGAYLLVEYLKDDVASCYFDPASHAVENPDPHHLSFHVFDPDDNASGGRSTIELSSPKALLRKVSYEFDPATSIVSRNGKPLLSSRFEQVLFVFVGPDFSKSPKQYGNYVTVRVTCAPDRTIEENRGREAEDRITRNVVTLITSISVQQKAALEVFPVWSETPEPTVEAR